MVTSSFFRRVLFLSLAALLPACATTVTAPGETKEHPNPAPDLQYSGKGFVVHEWGTDTIVAGSDGSLQRGLHHEEEDLPGFVYDRIKAGTLPGSKSVFVKMETPVTYFYSDVPRSVDVSVSFPKGVLTQWYPAVDSFYPFVAQAGDPEMDVDFQFPSEACAAKYDGLSNGLLDWGKVNVLARGETAKVPDAPIEKFTWAYARDVAANPLRVSGVPGAMESAQDERFLFYRGLGNFDLPVQVTSAAGGAITATNTLASAVGTVFVLNVGEEAGAFEVVHEGIAAGGSLAKKAPSLDGAQAIDSFVDALGDEVTDALDATGLYHDEAVAMVRTWKRQWFRTPGIRVLYLAPQDWTEASIPLSIDPKPEELVRVMMIRVEVITPELEADDVAFASKLADPAGAAEGKAHFAALGRFAEPRLRRAVALLGDPAYGEAALSEMVSSKPGAASSE